MRWRFEGAWRPLCEVYGRPIDLATELTLGATPGRACGK